MKSLATAIFLIVAVSVSGCFFGGDGLSCEDPQLYGRSDSAPPVRVPEGMSIPDESQALQIPAGERLQLPDDEEDDEEAPPNPCLEAPPDFFEEDSQA